MSNSTGQIVKTLADSFIKWFNDDILPVCFVSFDLLVIIIGVILNVMLIVTFRKRGLFNEPSTHFIFAMCTLDFVAYALLLIPNVISAIAGEWLLSQPVCEFHGAMIGVLMFSQFFILMILSIERTLKLVASAEKYYDKVFAKEKTVRSVICLTCGVVTIVAFIPVTGVADIKYDFYHHGCMLDYNESIAFLIVHFILTICLSFISFLVCYILIFNERRKAVIKNRQEAFKKALPAEQRKSETSTANDPSLATITEDDDTVFDGPSSDQEKIVQTPEPKGRRNTTTRPRSRPKSSPRQSMIFEVFSDDEENPAFHLSVTYLFLWSAMILCYLPYFIAFFYDTFTSGSLWGGIYSVTVLLTHASFVAKPIIYLGHNRHYREVTKQTVPQAIRNRARSVRNSVTSIQTRVEDFMFKSAGNKRFMATMAAHKAVLVWKKKLNVKKTKGSMELTKPGTNGTVEKTGALPKSILINKDPEAPVVDAESQPFSSKTSQLLANGTSMSNYTRNATITPSAIEVAPASSFIERERQRLAAMNGGAIAPANVSRESPNVQVTNIHVSDDETGNAVPGVVDDSVHGKSPTPIKAW